MSLRSLRYLLPLAALAGFFAPWGCSATEDNNSFPSGANGNGNGNGSGSGSGGAGGTGNNTGGSGGFNFGGNSGQGGSSVDPDAACAATSAEASLVPLDMLVVLDRSGSMSGTKWNGSVEALNTFVNDPASAGINVGLVLFPHEFPALDDCDYTAYDDLIVPIGELPQNAPAFSTALDITDPLGGTTPIYGALKGALFAATSYQDANPAHKVIVVFASDGEPNSCPGNQNQIPVIAALSSSALNYNGVQTYAIAIQGANLTSLNQIAAAGGTTTAFDVTSDVTLFAEKMAEIRTSALACEFLIPPPPDGEELDINKVAVRFTDSMGMESEIPRAEDAADCGAGPGWYYNNNVNPTKILLCPGSCDAVQGDAEGKLNVFFGCEPDVT
jgi:hypothetical protein